MFKAIRASTTFCTLSPEASHGVDVSCGFFKLFFPSQQWVKSQVSGLVSTVRL